MLFRLFNCNSLRDGYNTTNDPRQQSFTLDLTATEKAQIVAFMRTLTDLPFVNDPRFARSQSKF